MEVRQVDSAAEFRLVADDLLLADEAANNLILGVSGVARDVSRHEPFFGWIVSDGDGVAAAAAQTPPHNLILARTESEEAVHALAEAADDMPGVTGALPEVEMFVSHHPGATRTLRQGIYQLTEVRAAFEQNGHRQATRDDRELLINWMLAFHAEAIPTHVHQEQSLKSVDRRLSGPEDVSGFWIYELGDQPVAMSGYGAPTPNGIRIGPVYTPPEHRGKGYASHLVAAQSQWLLNSGRTFCFLYTDLANPTSNAIYQRIGYEMVAEAAEYSFSQTS